MKGHAVTLLEQLRAQVDENHVNATVMRLRRAATTPVSLDEPSSAMLEAARVLLLLLPLLQTEERGADRLLIQPVRRV